MLKMCRNLRSSKPPFYPWRTKCHGVSSLEPREVERLRDENRELKQIVAGPSLDVYGNNATRRTHAERLPR